MNESFMRRYIQRNATEILSTSMRKARRDGNSLVRMIKSKDSLLNRYANEEFDAFARGEINLPHLQVYVTDRCTFNCKGCVAFIPDLKKAALKPYYYDPVHLRSDIKALQQYVNNVRHIVLVGGEIFLHPFLCELMEIVLESGISDSVELVTNGGVLPKDAVLDSLAAHRERIFIRASEYSDVSSLSGRLMDRELAFFCKEHSIPFQKMKAPWISVGDFSMKLSRHEAWRTFQKCHFAMCVQLWDGKLAICPKARASYALGKLPMDAEIVDLRDSENLRERIIDFYSRDCFEACCTCNPNPQEIPVAEQLPRDEC